VDCSCFAGRQDLQGGNGFVNLNAFNLLHRNGGKALLGFCAVYASRVTNGVKDHRFLLRDLCINSGEYNIERQVQVDVI
jgi:hypothetical protein